MLRFKLKVLLAINNMTQKELAHYTGIRPPTISAICNGSIKQFPIDALEKICDVLDCQPSDIIEYVRIEPNLRTVMEENKKSKDNYPFGPFVIDKESLKKYK